MFFTFFFFIVDSIEHNARIKSIILNLIIKFLTVKNNKTMMKYLIIQENLDCSCTKVKSFQWLHFAELVAENLAAVEVYDLKIQQSILK